MNEYPAIGSEGYCQNASTDAPNRQLVLYAPRGVEMEIGLSWPAGGLIALYRAW